MIKKKKARSKNPFKNFRQDWLRYKKEAIEKNDYSFYKIFLEEVYKTHIKLYAELELPEAISLVDTILKTTTCELQVINIKSDNINYKNLEK